MIIDTLNEILLIKNYNITPNEYLLLRVFIFSSEEDSYLKEYSSLNNEIRGDVREILVSLQEKGIILKSYKIPEKGDILNLKEISYNKHFLNAFYKHSLIIGEELFEEYPIETYVNGEYYKLRRVSKKYNSLEEAFLTYGKYINWNPEKHKEIIELIKWGKENDYNFTTLGDFIVDRDWINIKSFQEKIGNSHDFNTTL